MELHPDKPVQTPRFRPFAQGHNPLILAVGPVRPNLAPRDQICRVHHPVFVCRGVAVEVEQFDIARSHEGVDATDLRAL